MISRNYATQSIGRPNTLSSGGNLRSDSSPSAQFFRRVEKSVVPALTSVGKYGVKQLAKAGTSTFKPIGQGLGLAAGVGATALTGNPELLPYLGSAGGYAGGKAGEYLKKKADKAIDRALA
jgi:hypothetical protein